jgi:hypothetical protein
VTGLSIEEIAQRAGVDADEVRRLIDVGVVGPAPTACAKAMPVVSA